MVQSSDGQWSPIRFLQTLLFFNAFPVVSCVQKMLFRDDAPQPSPPPGETVFNFRQGTAAIAAWGALDDVVMGGVSRSGLQAQGDSAVFRGEVSTANSGGFASIRTRNFEPPLDAAGATGIALDLQGDGQRYKFLLRDSNGWDTVAYTYSFDTVAGQRTTVEIPFSQLRPVFRAKTVADAAALDTHAIRSLQLMLSKFEYDGVLNPRFSPGPFQLQLFTVSFYGAAPTPQ